MSIVVFGSLNMDLVVRAPRLPAAGETVPGRSFTTTAGGKGANQAAAAARLGVQTRLIGRVGDDAFGRQLRAELQAAGVDVSGVATDLNTPTGVAIIAVEDSGENSIIVVPGANGLVGDSELSWLRGALAGATALLLQLEVPLEVVSTAARLASAKGVTVILDPAPACPLPADLFPLVDILTPNEREAGLLIGREVFSTADAEFVVAKFLDLGVQTALVKRGASGLIYGTRDQPTPQHIPAFKVETVDSVAAGDAFNGALAAALARGLSFDEALRWGAAAGALTVTRRGALAALPTLTELQELLTS